MDDETSVDGVVGKVVGKVAMIKVEGEIDVDKTITVVTVGRDPRTSSEQKRRRLILDVLRGTASLESKLFTGLWLPTSTPCLSLQNSAPTRRAETETLNRSQRFAVESMLMDGSKEMPRVVVIRGTIFHSVPRPSSLILSSGPPGTGKTSCIAAFTRCHMAADRGGLWLVAQSNVAVKNIAEKLVKEGCENWKLLVAPEFEHWSVLS
jgi:hypothetical protein